jgi:hypothetical protein
MKYEISVSGRNTYLYVRVSETVTAELLKDFIGETAKKAKECSIDNFLFDLRHAHNRTNLVAHYEMVYNQSKKLGFKPHSQHALVVSQTDWDDYIFVETILYNAGYKSKMFTDELSAIEWLEK